ncbi:Nitrate reductase [Bosea sp. 62]|jgi:formylglycine-generating enzyme required for sulfatase activity|uniref:SUMF1/EgtB/PvdO family nonheme iron enzyme n=1 Tax=unclassified Bosea (in: a-proteobacteria) TaxID=2653178 RepID=UPI00125815C6|nr:MULTISPECIES: SUMF1/EgtB/PvdO family nonheme iron enzyme [unclassified Bosea (in: a-proteobacteria)]CAD5294464.1 Nitrate reductase [Bosea sp. 21B]CAD5295011.1 Nitrate reductase [Bosea sp. 46]CAD5298709.1 Nitrate reductase [Bosea sp. 7B]VVT60882.1 Formylglycine-generating enzyme, required for sulfatase activity, contains SUMF1/FGE domain [Bosea sp. EC-HK365B]VXB37972.1 Nitrate reductase [Bosea sp. 127]
MATTLRPSLPSLATALGLVFMVGAAALLLAGPGHRVASTLPLPQTAVIPPATLLHRLDGEYSRANRPVDPPRVTVRIERPIEIMRYQVTVADYVRCVAAGACKHLDNPPGRGDLPVTGVSYSDATDYAGWLSRATGTRWRLPKDLEWVHAAGSRFVDDARGLDGSETNPALRWLADYEREANRKASSDPAPRPVGSFGANEHGVHDIAGNVWEWTQTCLRRVSLDAAGRTLGETSNCGVYIVEGQHRAPMTFFMRNPKAGGCSVATPPDNLGVRLVRDPDWRERLPASLRRLLPA